MLLADIKPDVRYRIQNVDFGTFLERRYQNDLLMRLMKENSEQQQVRHFLLL